jgi:hypothetical protein
MIGLSILLALLAYVSIVTIVARQVRSRTAKSLIVVLSVAIPVWDIVPGRLYFDSQCKRQAGLKIYKVIENVDGYRVDSLASGLGPQAMEKYGYKFEERGSEDNLTRFTIGPNGKVVRNSVTKSIARYAGKGSLTPLNWNVRKVEIVVFDQQTGEQLAMKTEFFAHGGWLQKLFHPYLGGDRHCGPPEEELYLRALRPAK